MLAALNLAYALAEQPANGTAASSSAIDVAGLVRRLDQALGADGQLL